jgi:hypothetical protein
MAWQAKHRPQALIQAHIGAYSWYYSMLWDWHRCSGHEQHAAPGCSFCRLFFVATGDPKLVAQPFKPDWDPVQPGAPQNSHPPCHSSIQRLRYGLSDCNPSSVYHPLSFVHHWAFLLLHSTFLLHCFCSASYTELLGVHGSFLDSIYCCKTLSGPCWPAAACVDWHQDSTAADRELIHF